MGLVILYSRALKYTLSKLKKLYNYLPLIDFLLHFPHYGTLLRFPPSMVSQLSRRRHFDQINYWELPLSSFFWKAKASFAMEITLILFWSVQYMEGSFIFAISLTKKCSASIIFCSSIVTASLTSSILVCSTSGKIIAMDGRTICERRGEYELRTAGNDAVKQSRFSYHLVMNADRLGEMNLGLRRCIKNI